MMGTGITRDITFLLLLIICTIISSISAFTTTKRSILYRIHTTISCNTIVLHANPLESLFKKDEIDNNTEFTSSAKEAEMMHRTAKMMEDHRRSQEAAERTAALMDELSSTQVIGKSKAGVGGGGIGSIGENRRGGVKATYDGKQQPLNIEVDPNFLFMSESEEGVISMDDLNDAITDAVQNGYELSTKLMEEKIKGLYEQLGLSREAQELPPEGED